MRPSETTAWSLVGEENGWYQVIVPEKTGYVSGQYLTVSENTVGNAAGTTSTEDAADDSASGIWRSWPPLMFTMRLTANGAVSSFPLSQTAGSTALAEIRKNSWNCFLI